MKTGFKGTFVISWAQTEVDGMRAAPLQELGVGTSWSWTGEAVRVDGPSEILHLERADDEVNIRRRAARTVRRLVGAAVANTTKIEEIDVSDPIGDQSFVVTDGAQTYTLTLIDVGAGAPLVMFYDGMPPRGRELWVVYHTLNPSLGASGIGQAASGGVICFTPGTRIETPTGPRLVEELREGDHVLTKDNGAEEIQWIGGRRMTGARLFAMPRLRPIRILSDALGNARPDQQLLVSPEHRILIEGQVARSLFNTPEVLVSAKDLINNSTIKVDLSVREVTYIHLLLPRHQVVWANGIETESFHPASVSLTTLDEQDRHRLLGKFPELDHDPHTYGTFARRNLSRSEAAILAQEAA